MGVLYRNIGKKLKSLAECIFLVEFSVSIILFIFLISKEHVAAAFLVLLIGFVSSFVSTWLLYAFGELVSRVCSIDEKLGALSKSNHDQTFVTAVTPAMSAYLAEQERTRRKVEWDAELQKRKEAEEHARQVVEERMRRKAEERSQKENGEN